MSKEQIIIDGVDVSGCTHKKNDACMAITDLSGDFCHYCDEEIMKNCYYKQLKRKEQECEEFRRANDEKNELLAKLGCPTIATARRKVFCLQEQLDQLKAENEQLKEELSVIQHNCNREGCRYYDDNTFKVFYECKAQKALQLSANSITTKYCDLLQTLTEIKEIAEKEVNNRMLFADKESFCDFNKILQKISECGGNDE